MPHQRPYDQILTDNDAAIIQLFPSALFIWQASPGACKACQALHNMRFPYTDLEQMGRPHLNCQCQVKVDHRTLNGIPEIIFQRDEPGPISGPIHPWNVPTDVDILQNIAEAKRMSLLEFILAVRSGGRWDYKRQGRQYEKFGNFNYGATGRALGLHEELLLRGAGAYQIFSGTSRYEYGLPTDIKSSSYGDDPRDQEMIRQGIIFYDRFNHKTR